MSKSNSHGDFTNGKRKKSSRVEIDTTNKNDRREG